MAMLSLPIAFSSALGVFAPVFSRPVWQHVKVLMTGAVLAPGKRTVTAILQIMGRSAAPDFRSRPSNLDGTGVADDPTRGALVAGTRGRLGRRQQFCSLGAAGQGRDL